MIDPLGDCLKKGEEHFPIKIPMIDTTHSFEMDIDIGFRISDWLESKMKLEVSYSGIDGSEYSFDRSVHPLDGIAPINFSKERSIVAEALEKIAAAIKSIR